MRSRVHVNILVYSNIGDKLTVFLLTWCLSFLLELCSNLDLMIKTNFSEVILLLFSRSVISVSLWPRGCKGFPVLHYLLEFAQTHIPWANDAIQPSHPLSPPSPPASIFPSIRVFSNKLALPIRWPKDWSFSFSPSNEYSGLVSFRIDWFYLLAVQWTVFFSTINWKHQFFCTQPTLWSNSRIHTWLLEKP